MERSETKELYVCMCVCVCERERERESIDVQDQAQLMVHQEESRRVRQSRLSQYTSDVAFHPRDDLKVLQPYL